MAAVVPGEGLRALLHRAALTPEQFARRLNHKSSELGLPNRIDPKTPYKWMKGVTPRQPWPTLATALLSAILGTRIGPEDLGWEVTDSGVNCVPADCGLDVPWSTAGALRAAREVVEVDPVDRRLFLQLTGTALTAPALEWLLAHTDGHGAGRPAGRRVVHDTHVDAIEQVTDQFRRMDDQFGGGAVLDVVQSQTKFVLNLLANYRYSSGVGQRLYGAAGELMRLGGWVSFDAGLQSRAQRLWLAALRCSHAAGDRALGANILGCMSIQAMNLRLHGEAVKLAEAARHGYSGDSPVVRSILDLRAAQAYACSGEVTVTIQLPTLRRLPRSQA